jgi:hypothetical protein
MDDPWLSDPGGRHLQEYVRVVQATAAAFRQSPQMRITAAEAASLWGVEQSSIRFVFHALERGGFLASAADGTFHRPPRTDTPPAGDRSGQAEPRGVAAPRSPSRHRHDAPLG